MQKQTVPRFKFLLKLDMVSVWFLASNRPMWTIECNKSKHCFAILNPQSMAFCEIASAQKPCFFAMESALRWKPSCNMGFLRRPAQKAWFQPRNPINGIEKSHNLISLFESFVDILFWARHGVGFWPGNPLWRIQKKSLVFYVIICYLE